MDQYASHVVITNDQRERSNLEFQTLDCFVGSAGTIFPKDTFAVEFAVIARPKTYSRALNRLSSDYYL